MSRSWQNMVGTLAEQAPLVGGGQDCRGAMAQQAPSINIGVLGETRGLEDDVVELEVAVVRAEALLRGTDVLQPATPCPAPSALAERLNSSRQRIRMVKMALDRICIELVGD